jgi:ceramide glucosyltransferase
MTALAYVAMVWWGIALLLLAASTLASLAFPWSWRRETGEGAPSPITAIVPVHQLDSGFELAQASLFEQAYPNTEVLIGSAEETSAALDMARVIHQRNRQVDARVVTSAVQFAASPKLNTLWIPIQEARHDLIFTKDSNIVLAPGDIESFVRHMRPGVGLVSALTILMGPRSPAAWVETSIINGHYARMLMLARALGMGFGLGKVMLFRRSDLDRAGGLGQLAWALGEDSALSDALLGLGLRTVLADRLTLQQAGDRSWRDLWNRLLRWKLIWRVQRPSLFVTSLFDSAFLAAIAGALAAPLMGLAPGAVAVATLLTWCAVECLLCSLKGWPLSIGSPFAFLVREALDLLVWLRALTTSEVVWAGTVCRSDKGRARFAPV